MPLVEPLPEQVENALKEHEDGASEQRLAFATDIGAHGVFGEEWLVVTARGLYVFSPNGGTVAETRHALSLDTIREARTDALVGNGVLEVRVENGHGSEVVPVLRYSNSVVGKANAAVRLLTSVAKGEDLKLEEIEEKKKCPRCGRRLPEDSSVCRA